MPIHSLDRIAIRDELRRRGWSVNEYGHWVRLSALSDEQAEQDWIEATICGIQCKHEDARRETIRLERERMKRQHITRGGDSDTSR